MKKQLTFIILLAGLFSFKTFSQGKENTNLLNQRDSALPMIKVETKNIDLSKQQKEQIKKYERSNDAKVAAIKKNNKLTEKQRNEKLLQLEKEKNAKLEAILTPEQKEKMKQTQEIKPHRGVTNMPNERTAK